MTVRAQDTKTELDAFFEKVDDKAKFFVELKSQTELNFLDKYAKEKPRLIAEINSQVEVAKREVRAAENWPFKTGTMKVGRMPYNNFVYASQKHKADVVFARQREQRQLESQAAALRRGDLMIPIVNSRIHCDFGRLENGSATIKSILTAYSMAATCAYGASKPIINDEGKLETRPPSEMTLWLWGFPTAGHEVGEKVSLAGFILTAWNVPQTVDGQPVPSYFLVDLESAKRGWEERREKAAKK
jgi:hypothetical protein